MRSRSRASAHMARFVCLLIAVMVGAASALAAPAENEKPEGPMKWVPMGQYVRNNPFWDLEITKVEAKYEPFIHNQNDPKKCDGSRITFTFTIKNAGRKALPLPAQLLYEANMAKPWMMPETTVVVDNPKPEDLASLRSWIRLPQRKLKPGESIKVSEWLGPPLGPWNPLRIEARLGRQGASEATFVGKQQPFRQTVTLSAPDYRIAQATVFRLEAKPVEQCRRFKIAALVTCDGPDVGGPVQATVSVFSKGTDNFAIRASGSSEKSGSFDFKSEELVSRREIDPTRAEMKVLVGCPIHGWATRLVDANPANNLEIRGATKAEPLLPPAEGEGKDGTEAGGS